MMGDTVMIGCVMRKILCLTFAVKCSMFNVGCVASMAMFAILVIICVILILQNKMYGVGYLCNLLSHPHNSVSYPYD